MTDTARDRADALIADGVLEQVGAVKHDGTIVITADLRPHMGTPIYRVLPDGTNETDQ